MLKTIKIGELKTAETLFSSVSKEYFGGDEALIAQRFLTKKSNRFLSEKGSERVFWLQEKQTKG